jgi:hypothetical protein
VEDPDRRRGVEPTHALISSPHGLAQLHAFGDVVHDQHAADPPAILAEEGRGRSLGHHLRSIRAPDAPASVGDLLPPEGGASERELAGWVRGALQGEEAEHRAPALDGHVDFSHAMQPGRRGVHEREAARLVGEDHAVTDAVEHPAQRRRRRG